MFSKNNRITDNSLLLHVVLGEQLIQLLQEKERWCEVQYGGSTE